MGVFKTINPHYVVGGFRGEERKVRWSREGTKAWRRRITARDDDLHRTGGVAASN